ncbi:uncharacterized protein [Choristoneura fumiferana]|uniref:uncharacterized protein n=1 Tax=Choristoneura fumiferana TaxID=7141 RepID=UPI003D153AFD
MFKCVLLLAVLGCSTSYHHHGHYSSQPSHPSQRPDQSGHPEHDDQHDSSHSGSWHYHSGYHDGFGRFKPNDGHIGNTRQWPKPNNHYPSEIGFVAHHSDYSDTDSDGDDKIGNVSGEHDAVNPIRFDNQESTGNRQNGTLERGEIGQNITGQIVATNARPLNLNDRDVLTRGDVPPEADTNINPRKSYIVKPTDSTNKYTSNRFLKPMLNQTKETNATLTQAYITGPDNTLVKDLRANNTKLSQSDSLKSSTATSVRVPIKSFDVTTKALEFIPTTPRPGIGSIPVPLLSQFVAPSLQWNVGIYSKMTTPYSQICGGSLVKTDAVLTAAHCFWSDGGALRPALFAAAAGKLLRTWDDAGAFVQQSDIKEILIPPRFRGALTSFQDDIAIAKLSVPFQYAPGVKPVCVDFDVAFEREQLAGDGRKGTIVGWGSTEPNGPPSERLNFLELPYLEIQECLKLVPATFIKYITSDKICAGDSRSGLAACKGDSGGGLVFTSSNVPYIRGIVSTAPREGTECNPFTPATFTQITAHMTFLTDHIPNIAEDCRAMYEEIKTSTVVNDSKGNIENSGTNIAENIRTVFGIQNETVERNAGCKSGNSNVTSGQLKSNVTVINEERRSNAVPVSLLLNTSTGQRHECNCFCDQF